LFVMAAARPVRREGDPMCPYCGCVALSRHGGACPRNLWQILARLAARPKLVDCVFLSTALAVVSLTAAFLYLR
jgi:hypothetical protein